MLEFLFNKVAGLQALRKPCKILLAITVKKILKRALLNRSTIHDHPQPSVKLLRGFEGESHFGQIYYNNKLELSISLIQNLYYCTTYFVFAVYSYFFFENKKNSLSTSLEHSYGWVYSSINPRNILNFLSNFGTTVVLSVLTNFKTFLILFWSCCFQTQFYFKHVLYFIVCLNEFDGVCD